MSWPPSAWRRNTCAAHLRGASIARSFDLERDQDTVAHATRCCVQPLRLRVRAAAGAALRKLRAHDCPKVNNLSRWVALPCVQQAGYGLATGRHHAATETRVIDADGEVCDEDM